MEIVSAAARDYHTRPDMKFHPFIALRAAPEFAGAIAAPPYDVVDRAEARQWAEGNPRCFLRVSRPDLEFPDATPPDDPAVYRRAAERFAQFRAEGWLIRDTGPAFYLYRIADAAWEQRGVVGVCDVSDYESGAIRRHEKTRAAPEADRIRHTEAINANAGPVLLAWPGDPRFAALCAEAERGEPLYDIRRPDGVRHTIWHFSRSEPLAELFGRASAFYIADGHHRAASAAAVARRRRAVHPAHTGAEEYNRFLAVVFPADQLRIGPYNRKVRDLNGWSPHAFLAAVRSQFDVHPARGPVPSGPGRIALWVEGIWWELSWTLTDAERGDPVSALDVSVLQNRLLSPVLGVRDPRTDPRLVFRGGAGSAEALAADAARGEGAAVFSLFPVNIAELMAVADAGLTMPPKSTWFEPKLLSGLLTHTLDDASGQ